LLRLAFSLPTLGWDEALLRLALAAALGGLIGLERELREQEAGVRTHLLVGVGSALFTIAGAYGFHDFLVSGGNVVRTDPTRIAAQIVTGIGFLGAGAIIRQGLAVRGLTTAATLLVVAALYPLRIIAYKIVRRFRPEDGRLFVALPAGRPPGRIIDEVERSGARIEAIGVSQEDDRRRLELDVSLARDTPAAALVARVAEIEDVAEVRWGG
jgi:uncharacterized membrane protein YhiD involved in acid resistance